MGFVLHIAELDVGGGSAEADISGFDVDSDSAKYRAEGNANIALSLLPQKQILRIPKSSRFSIANFRPFVSLKLISLQRIDGIETDLCVQIHQGLFEIAGRGVRRSTEMRANPCRREG